MLDLARLEQELVSVYLDARGFETNLHLDAAGSGVSVEIKERMLVTPQFPFHFPQKLVTRDRLRVERR